MLLDTAGVLHVLGGCLHTCSRPAKLCRRGWMLAAQQACSNVYGMHTCGMSKRGRAHSYPGLSQVRPVAA